MTIMLGVTSTYNNVGDPIAFVNDNISQKLHLWQEILTPENTLQHSRKEQQADTKEAQHLLKRAK